MAYADLVSQTTSTTGTGTYTISGDAPEGMRTFLTAFPSNESGIPYFVTDDAGNFEAGIGSWNSGAGTLARTKVLASSNSNAAVNWAAGTKRIYVAAHSGVMALAGVRHNLQAMADPDGEGASDGYGPGSLWQSINGWWIYTGSGWMAITPIKNGDGAREFAVKDNSGNDKAVLTGDGAVHLGGNPVDSYPGGNDLSGLAGLFALSSGGLRFDYEWQRFTADATPAQMEDSSFTSGAIAAYVGESGVIVFEAMIFATKIADPKVCKAWKVKVGAGNDASGTMTLGTPITDELYEHASATAWAVAPVVVTDGSVGNGAGIALQVTGAAATDIKWGAAVRCLIYPAA